MASRIYFPGRTASSRFPVQHGFTAASLASLQIALNQIALERENTTLAYEQASISADLHGGLSADTIEEWEIRTGPRA